MINFKKLFINYEDSKYNHGDSKPLLNDAEAENVDVSTLNRSMIGFIDYVNLNWVLYNQDSPFDLEAYSDSDYAGASLDRKSTTVDYDCNKRLLRNGMEQQLMMKFKLCCWHNLLVIQALVDKKKVIVTETSARRALQLKDAEGTECLPNATIFAELQCLSAKTTT
ncbi:hypothetical protein Tco_0167614 [Tanacetum coccineum]